MATIRMRRNRKGQFVKASSNPPKRKHHRKRKHNFISAGAAVPLVNRRKKHHRRRRHNPPLALPLPGLGRVEFPIGTIIGVSAGLAGPPIVEGFAKKTFPTQTAAYPTLTTIGSNLAVLAGGYMLGGRKGMRDVAIGEVAGFVVKQIQAAASKLTGVAGYVGPTTRNQMSGYTGPTPRRQLNGMRGGVNAYPAMATRFQSRFVRTR